MSVIGSKFPLLFALLIYCLSCKVFSKQFVPPSKPNYELLEKVNDTVLHKDPLFIKACKEAAGYYIDPSRDPSLSNTIVIAGANYGYRDFFHNFKCYMERIGVKFLPLSLDPEIYEYISSNKITPTYLMPELAGRGAVRTKASGFGGPPFNLIGCLKLEAVAAALKLGYDVIFSDVDIAVLRDPINYLFFPGVDYVHSDNSGCARQWSFTSKMEGNTGFYAAKSNPATIRTWELAFKSCSQTTLYDDQTMFWLILRTNMNPAPEPRVKCPAVGGQHKRMGSRNGTIVTCPLDNCMFSASNLREGMFGKLTQTLKTRKHKAVMAHANWMNGRDMKKAALVRNGLWIAQKVDADGNLFTRPAAGAGKSGGGGGPAQAKLSARGASVIGAKGVGSGTPVGFIQVENGGSVKCKQPSGALVTMN